ncbi:4-hydroxy-tetrahydrodipicolinate synthase [Cupriavidus oxalaticus]|jgi:4-hydroxy-tetrahydrodipicolinate synthase|uniref:4-hydroxy-tetrahydrodipicolinate synthase n=1 Tax=Cupriavidus oxalaticus TaxID=96344 RepID=A0A976BFD8_9BURK|nr:4-hydroxy-tetrahydrodipicolinate synthase [Cupriavidus oxalaticus]QRQ86391.1 4-hydroxy-tetrahydrodipicolinate synthase [Cupriavidus oxalaticus]QRQ95282.1 4-hydroxy-tetrahydrodipicolinate synthase [Cupriavidus oxalaticus]WQD83938.1 4-hydroxy-tetrahydrodipicolinate synthase [Cupriavidus oxalaticus]SPC17233.1 dihydrodipicolinate synthase [Cupriavidus oxalaticus]
MTQITGSIVAIVTPMHEDGSLDFPALRALVDWHVAEGTDGIVIVGTTGESPTVSVEEHCELIRVAVEQSGKRIPIIAGTGGNSTKEAIELTAFAKKVGADASLQVVPYYNKPTQEGMYRHFRTIAEAVELPVLLYNVPGRTVADMSNDTILRLAQVPGIVGVKEATGNIDRAAQLINDAPESFAIYSGDDPTAVALILLGGKGNISVTANVAPRKMHEMCAAALKGDVVTARRLHMELIGLNKAMFVEANPIPVKWALQQMGKMEGGIRLPLTPLSESNHETVRKALAAAGLLA